MARPSIGQRPAARGGRRPAHTPARQQPVPGERAPAPPMSRDVVRTVAGLNVLAGIWLIIAPFVLGYGDGDPYWNDIVFGAIVVVLGASRGLFALRQTWLSALNVLIGAWIFISAFWLDSTGKAAWNDVILGAIVFVLGVIAWSERGGRAPASTNEPAV